MMHKYDLNNLLNILKLTGGKFIIVEEGKPMMVLMSYEEFSELAVPHYARGLASMLGEGFEEINEKITRAQLQDLRQEVIAEVPDLDQSQEGEISIHPLE